MQVRRMCLAGHCARHTEKISNKLVLWEPTDGIAYQGRRFIPCIDERYGMNDTGV